jgi:hypothetical protein
VKLTHPHHPQHPEDGLARVFSIDHARGEKRALLEQEGEHERRRWHGDRILSTFGWYDLGALVALGLYNVMAVIGFAWLIGRVIASLEAGVWL